LVFPAAVNLRSDVQIQDVRDLEIDPNPYYPKGFKPNLILDWPSPGKAVFLPESKVSDEMTLEKK